MGGTLTFWFAHHLMKVTLALMHLLNKLEVVLKHLKYILETNTTVDHGWVQYTFIKKGFKIWSCRKILTSFVALRYLISTCLVNILLALVQGVRPFSVKISGLVCVASFTFNPAFHQNSKVFSYNLALPLIYWSSLWFTKSRTDHWP